MISIKGLNDKLVVFLDGPVTTNELQCFSTFSFVNKPMNQLHLHRDRVVIETDGTSEVILAQIKEQYVGVNVETIGVYNSDTVSTYVNVGYNDGISMFILKRIYLAPGSTLSYSNDNGWSIDSATDPSTVPGVVEVRKSDDVVIASVDVISGKIAPYNVADSTLTVNGLAYTDVKATDSFDIKLIDEDLNPITPTSIVGDVVTVNTGASGLPSGTYTPKNTIGGAFDLLWQGATANITTGSGTVSSTGGSAFKEKAIFKLDHPLDFSLNWKVTADNQVLGLCYFDDANYPNEYYYTIDHCVLVQGGTFYVFSNGATAFSTSFSSFTKLITIKREGLSMKYQIDGVTVYAQALQFATAILCKSCLSSGGGCTDIQVIIP